MKNLFIIIALLLNGCAYQAASEADINRALAFCKDKQGIDELIIVFNGDEKVTCANGQSTSLTNVKTSL
jgi:hypothetical protein